MLTRLSALKKKLQREGVFREMKMRGHYESSRSVREKAEAVRRSRKLARKRTARVWLRADASHRLAKSAKFLSC